MRSLFLWCGVPVVRLRLSLFPSGLVADNSFVVISGFFSVAALFGGLPRACESVGGSDVTNSRVPSPGLVGQACMAVVRLADLGLAPVQVAK